MKAQRDRARAARGNIGGWDSNDKEMLAGIATTCFTGYTETETEAKVIAIIADGMLVNEISEGEFTLILDMTPFYGEGGGQVGDTGVIANGDFTATVHDTKKTDGIFLHVCELASGAVKVGDTVTATVDSARRDAIKRNHSSLHLLQGALRQVLGTHVEQSGSYVDAERGRFDFTHFAAVTAEELAKVEALVNATVLSGIAVETIETDIESAKKLGAMMLFGEKYGATVRVVKMGDASTEFCGGTHVDNTAKIGLFKIVSESSVAAGIRRIEVVTGLGVLDLLAAKDKLITETASELKVQNPVDIAKKAAQLQSEIAGMKKEIESLNSKLAGSKLTDVLAGAVSVGSVKLVTYLADGMEIDAARSLSDKIKAENADMVAVLAVKSGDKLNFIAVAGKDAVAAGAHAGKLVGAVAAVTGGKGGGRPDNAMAGGRDASKITEALEAAKATLEGMIK